MELRKLIKLLKKNLGQLVTISLLFGLISGVISLLRPETYELELFLDVGSTGSQKTNDYKFDNYYRYENSRRLIFSMVEWLEDEALIKLIMDEAKVGQDNFINLNAEQVSDTTLKINWETKVKDDLKKIVKEIENALQKKVNTVNDNTDITYTIYSDKYVINDGNSPTWLISLAGILVGLWGTFLWIILRDYYRR